MQVNKSNLILKKAKLVCLKLDKSFVIIPYTFSKIELRMRNILANNRKTMDSISHFMAFYLVNKQFQTRLMSKYSDFLKAQQDMEYEARFNGKKQGVKGGVSSQSNLLNPAASNNYTTNYSSNNQPVPSGSLGQPPSESIINVAVGESAFVNSNAGNFTIDKH